MILKHLLTYFILNVWSFSGPQKDSGQTLLVGPIKDRWWLPAMLSVAIKKK